MTLDYQHPEKYLGSYRSCFIGYAADELIREGAASGGVVTGLLIFMLEKGYIQGALVSRSRVRDGKLEAETFIARTRDELLDCRTSIYMDFPLAKHFKDLLNFDGKVAIVALPCQMQALEKMKQKYPLLKDKIYLRIALFCSGSPSPALTEKVMKKCGISLLDVRRVVYRRGHWRGRTHVEMRDGTVRELSYLYNLCTYKNLYFDSLPRCYSCQDHFSYRADISCGDVWLKEMKDHPVKHTGFVVRTETAEGVVQQMAEAGVLQCAPVDAAKVLRSQKRAATYKYSAAQAKMRIGPWFGLKYDGQSQSPSKWNHYLAVFLISMNIRWSKHPFLGRMAYRLPRRLMFLYMGWIRFLLNF